MNGRARRCKAGLFVASRAAFHFIHPWKKPVTHYSQNTMALVGTFHAAAESNSAGGTRVNCKWPLLFQAHCESSAGLLLPNSQWTADLY
ncbi:hypothetical protein KOW79_019557 [Hemibagrus wyckioides]|uniref:Uncharacterized protein n=1 Tax=Hemibagrus wyckioides TaxID=337641 RepID=A0A9D3N7C2_9TELE|nr:hypothetical protein KOW79_019557 [Hemibagrus wyckioides]